MLPRQANRTTAKATGGLRPPGQARALLPPGREEGRELAYSFGSQAGQDLVEFALGALVFLLIVFGILDFGRAIYVYTVVASAAREGARYGAVHPEDPDGMVAAAQERAVGVAVTVGPIVVSTPEVQVSVSASYRSVTPLIGAVVGQLTLRSTARQYREVVRGVSP